MLNQNTETPDSHLKATKDAVTWRRKIENIPELMTFWIKKKAVAEFSATTGF